MKRKAPNATFIREAREYLDEYSDDEMIDPRTPKRDYDINFLPASFNQFEQGSTQKLADNAGFEFKQVQGSENDVIEALSDDESREINNISSIEAISVDQSMDFLKTPQIHNQNPDLSVIPEENESNILIIPRKKDEMPAGYSRSNSNNVLALNIPSALTLKIEPHKKKWVRKPTLSSSELGDPNGCYIHPESRLVSFWGYTDSAFMLYVLIVLPVKFSFIEETHKYWDLFDNLIDFFFGLGIILNFFLAFRDEEGNLHTQVKPRLKRYLKLWFWVDLLSIFPFQYFFQEGNFLIFLRISRFRYIGKLGRFLKYGRGMNKKNRFLEVLNKLLLQYPTVKRISINLFWIFLVCHLFACAWHYIAAVQGHENNWIVTYNMTDSSAAMKYLTSLYWITQTIITVGYGDISAQNTLEQIISILAMFTGVIFFSLTIGALTSLLNEIDSRNKVFEKKVNILHMIKDKYSISDHLYDKIKDTLALGVYHSDSRDIEFMNSLPDKLKTEVAFRIYNNKVENVKFFKKIPPNIRTKAISEIGPHLKKVFFSKSDHIFADGDHASEIYFLENGVVCLAYVDEESKELIPFYNIKKGDFFGHIDLIFERPRQFTAIAQSDINAISVDGETIRSIFFGMFRSIGHYMRRKAIKSRKIQLMLYEKSKAALQQMRDQRQHLEIQKRAVNDIEDILLPFLLQVFEG